MGHFGEWVTSASSDLGAEGPNVAEGHQPSAGAGKVAPVRARPFLVIYIFIFLRGQRQGKERSENFFLLMKVVSTGHVNNMHHRAYSKTIF